VPSCTPGSQVRWRTRTGTLLAVMNLAYGLSIRLSPKSRRRDANLSRLLLGATIVLPGGFLVGGVTVYGGDPGLGALIIPIGALLLIAAAILAARGETHS
jgi:hypothetical protein